MELSSASADATQLQNECWTSVSTPSVKVTEHQATVRTPPRKQRNNSEILRAYYTTACPEKLKGEDGGEAFIKKITTK